LGEWDRGGEGDGMHAEVLYIYLTNILIIMKRTFALLILMVVILAPSFGQENYKVIKVNGEIVLKEKGTPLQTGTEFSKNDNLVFRTEDATAAVINSQKGRLILTSRNHDLAAAGSNYMPAMYNIASRGGMILSLSDLSKLFEGKYVILGRQNLVLNPSIFPMNSNSFFFLRYNYKNEEINKKLDYSGDTLIIDRSRLYTVDGKPIPGPDNTTISLYYRKGSESSLVNRFELIFPDESQLRKEVSIIMNEFSKKTEKELFNEIGAYITDNYGKVSPENLKAWIQSNFGAKTK
jgi:hypothetical protein